MVRASSSRAEPHEEISRLDLAGLLHFRRPNFVELSRELNDIAALSSAMLAAENRQSTGNEYVKGKERCVNRSGCAAGFLRRRCAGGLRYAVAVGSLAAGH